MLFVFALLNRHVEKVRVEECVMVTNTHYENRMEPLSLHRPADRHVCAQGVASRDNITRDTRWRHSSSSAASLSVGSDPAPPARTRQGVISAPLLLSQRHCMGRGGDCVLADRGGQHQQQTHLPPSCFPSWRGAGKAGRRDYFSVPCSDDSRGALMQSASRREEVRELQRLWREIKLQRF
ncbi:hypothetical protein TraAM80_08188 [Trypanosoma rangeli]|uniref:Uncharacterized protein n=1 Tax=Trypanosoma rangeli TaxID=5698 RepID=A0A3R7KFN3_TRYRA|nr:uncharacterized protein TraAM80_08188 [Trypanosoma rangeli]RNE99523.1 hypothetical protein TraAM80_08188 [Trypanosoma rangeli]|eukprot:RNE99523.1 hypothetical protein TraAM80_08188 [Trypanosoma rangeli]